MSQFVPATSHFQCSAAAMANVGVHVISNAGLLAGTQNSQKCKGDIQSKSLQRFYVVIPPHTGVDP